jgi:hypothetical protein
MLFVVANPCSDRLRVFFEGCMISERIVCKLETELFRKIFYSTQSWRLTPVAAHPFGLRENMALHGGFEFFLAGGGF